MVQQFNASVQAILKASEDFDWDRIQPECVMPVLTQLVVSHRAMVSTALSIPDPNWDNTLSKLSELDGVLDRFWSIVSHLRHVVFTSAWEAAYTQALALITQYSLERSLDPKLLTVTQILAERAETHEAVNPARYATVQLMLRDFKLSGMLLPSAQQSEIKHITAQLSQLSAQISTHVLRATDATQIWVRHAHSLKGLVPDCIAQARVRAQNQKREGWCLSIEDSDYMAVMRTASERRLRRRVFQAYRTRASEHAPVAGDNGPLLVKMLKGRQKGARLLGFKTYAHQVLETRIVGGVDDVSAFLDGLAQRIDRKARSEWLDLKQFASDHLNIKRLQPWDTAYALTQFEMHTLGFDPQVYRPYFPLSAVLSGLHEIVQTVLGLRVTIEPCAAWVPGVQCWRIEDPEKGIDARCWIDLFARPGKQGGAWMDECQTRWRQSNGEVMQPVAFLTCNFMPPTGHEEAQLTHDEVLTLFHEFGHTLHHCLSEVDVPNVSGISGVAWDAVEVPSQLFECWCWTQEGLSRISRHIKTGAQLPDKMITALQHSRQFMAATGLMRQVALSQFDWQLHIQPKQWTADKIYTLYQQVMRRYTQGPVWLKDRMPAAFTHVFSGGYAAGYYSYLFAEVMSDDAFSRFEEEGLFSQTVGRALRDTILSQGAVKPADQLFEAFRGRSPSIEALLKHRGLLDAA